MEGQPALPEFIKGEKEEVFSSKLGLDHTEREMDSDLLSPDKGHERLGVLSRMGCGIRRCLAAGKDSEALGK